MDKNSTFTPHAKRQMQKRGILPVDISFLEKYAECRRASGNAFCYLITRKAVEQAVTDGRISPQLADKLLNCVYVVEMVPFVKTAYKQEGGFNSIRRVHRGKINRKSHKGNIHFPHDVD